MTKGDNIRQMLQTDESLADFMIELGLDNGVDYCRNKPECDDLLDDGNKTVPDEWCRRCLIEWLQEENDGES